MIAWLALHWTDVMFHLGLDLSGGLTLRCAMGMCEHPRHQAAVWTVGALAISVSTVAVVG